MKSSRRVFIGQSSLGIASLLLAPKLFAKGSFQSGDFKMIRKNVGYFTGSGGTIGWLVNEDGVVVVDSQFPDSAKTLIAEIQRKTDKKFDYLINTHHHGDHTGGNIAFKEIVNHVVAHENSKKNQMRVAKERDQEEGQLYPEVTFANKWSKRVGAETISCTYHGRGHTNGDILIHFEDANVVHMGDLVFNRRFPYIDKSAGANISSWIDVLDKTKAKFDAETIFIFGHSDNGYDVTGNIEDVKEFTNYLEQLMVQVEKAVKLGKTLDEMKAEITNISGASQWKGKGISRSLESAYSEIIEEK